MIPEIFGPRHARTECCRSSVVEHSIGNGEVLSSILSGSTILGAFLIFRLRSLRYFPCSQPKWDGFCSTDIWFPDTRRRQRVEFDCHRPFARDVASGMR